MRRSELDICADILEAASIGVRKTRLVYGTNLNFTLIKVYLKKLIGWSFIEERGGVYYTTDKGKGFVENYKELNCFVD